MGIFDKFKKKNWAESQKNPQPTKSVVDNKRNEIAEIINSWNFQWENFNKVIQKLTELIISTIDLDFKVAKSNINITLEKISFALTFPFFVSEEYFDKDSFEFDKMWQENNVTRVSTDTLRVSIILKTLNEILNIDSAENFWDRNYKIWDIEINSYEDLEQHRKELQSLYNRYENYNIPRYKEAVEYAAKNGISTTFYL